MMKSPLLLVVVYFTLMAVTVVTLPAGAVRAQGSADVSLEQQIQAALTSAGFDAGPVDGKFGPKTRRAIQAWQRANGHAGTGYLTRDQLRSILTEATPEPFGPNWIVTANQPCQLYNPNPEPGESVTWSGACVNGKASGKGRFIWHHSAGVDVYDGEYRDGKPHGYGTVTWADGTRFEGQWRNGCFEKDGQIAWYAPEDACGFD